MNQLGKNVKELKRRSHAKPLIGATSRSRRGGCNNPSSASQTPEKTPTAREQQALIGPDRSDDYALGH